MSHRKLATADNSNSCQCNDDGCGDHGVERRQFMKLVGLGAASLGAGSMPVMAGPFDSDNEYLQAISEDKKLDPAWVRSLYERGEKETYSDPVALGHVGMPVGGMFAGTVYLSGDGRLWLWDIFNRDQEGIAPRKADKFVGIGNAPNCRSGLNYLQPAPVDQPFGIGFTLRIGETARSLDLDGFSDVTFDGRYPMGRVGYRDGACPLEIELEAFSPFIPLNTDDSSLPATVMSYTLHNPSSESVQCTLSGHLENPICLDSGKRLAGTRSNRIVEDVAFWATSCSARPLPATPQPDRADIVFDDFEKPTYEGWTAEGVAFGEGPIEISKIPDYQDDVSGKGKRVVNSHASAPGGTIQEKDGQVGSLTSRTFTVERRFIHFQIGGGSHKNETCVNLLVGGEVVASATGRDDNRMTLAALDVRKHEGQEAQLQILDQVKGAWGNIGIDQIVFSDRAPSASGDDLEQQHDFGTMTLALLGSTADDHASASADAETKSADGSLDDSLVGRLGRTITIEPGGQAQVEFVVAWHFPNFYGHKQWFRGERLGHWYAAKFDSANSVVRYVAEHFDRLSADTRKWVDVWYDSSLPYWLLDRTIANTSTLATTTCYRHQDGRYWSWEGIGCCPGTCTHVWHYAQAPGRLFPSVERDQRERVDFGLAFNEQSGAIHYRAEVHNHHADDGQCGRILGAYREHQMSADDAFLRRLWPNIKKAVQFMIARDADADGILNGAQPNTLDAAWYGKISFTSSLYLATLKAGEAMAREMDDEAFADECAAIAKTGASSILELFNGEYFVQLEDPQHSDKIGVGPGCYIDQIFGQSWAHWVNLGTICDREKQHSALKALWKYNFVPDCGPFREKFTRGRWYATAGDAGLIMCSWPKGGKNPSFQKHWQFMYFNECMSGFEWQVAAHMIWEGLDDDELLKYGLAISRAIHDRYNAALRNPYNEVECSDHYARAMASYGAFQAACGFNCHGPKGHVEFAPRLSADAFRAPFTAADAWGTIAQKRDGQTQVATITPRWGQLRLRSVALTPLKGVSADKARVRLADTSLDATIETVEGQIHVTLASEVTLSAEDTLTITLG